MYLRAVQEYIDSLDEEEATHHSINDYLRNAREIKPKVSWIVPPPLPIVFIINSGIQYDAPHTMGNCIVIPERYNASNFDYICNHEIIHIYFRYCKSRALQEFCQWKGIVKVNRPRMRGEITNPDTSYKTALKSPWGLISPVIYSPNDVKFITLKESWQLSKKQEIDFYNRTLPYEQNYHPEEILAELYSKSKLT